MNFLFYLIGLLVGVAVFFYFLSLYHSGADALAARRNGAPKKEGGMEIDAAALDPASQQAYPRERVCPLCAAVLTKYEVLYASRVETPGGDKILIHGCRYCHRPGEENGAKQAVDGKGGEGGAQDRKPAQ
jgi:hypothetical protein